MTKPLSTLQLAKLEELCGGNKAAVKFCLDLLWVGHLWDDLIDGDVERSRAEVNRAFQMAFHELWVNPFVQALPVELRWQLNGLVASSALQYIVSTELERSEKLPAFICRNAIFGVLQYVAVLCGTPVERTAELYRLFDLGKEYLGFLKETIGHEGVNEG